MAFPVSITSSVLTPPGPCTPVDYLQHLHAKRDALRSVGPELPWADSDEESQSSSTMDASARRTRAITDKVRSLLALHDKAGGKDASLATAMIPRALKLTCTQGGKRWLPRVYSSAPKPCVPVEAVEATVKEADVFAKVANWVKTVEPPDFDEEARRKTFKPKTVAKSKSGFDLKDPSPLGFVVSKRRMDATGKGGKGEHDGTPLGKRRKLNEDGDNRRASGSPKSPVRPELSSSSHTPCDEPILRPPPDSSPVVENDSTMSKLTSSPFALKDPSVLLSTNIHPMPDLSIFPPSFRSQLENSTPPGEGKGKKRARPQASAPSVAKGKAKSPVSRLPSPSEEQRQDNRIRREEGTIGGRDQRKMAAAPTNAIHSPTGTSPVKSTSVTNPSTPTKNLALTKSPSKARIPSEPLYLDVDLASPTKSLSSIAADSDTSSEDEVGHQLIAPTPDMFASTQMGRWDSQRGVDFEGELDDLMSFVARDVDMGDGLDLEESQDPILGKRIVKSGRRSAGMRVADDEIEDAGEW